MFRDLFYPASSHVPAWTWVEGDVQVRSLTTFVWPELFQEAEQVVVEGWDRVLLAVGEVQAWVVKNSFQTESYKFIELINIFKRHVK